MTAAHRPPLRRGLLLFWSAWFTVVFASNLADGLRSAGLLPEGWRFASGNFALIVGAVERYGLGASAAALLFAAVVLLQLAAATLFWRATFDRRADGVSREAQARRAYGVAIALFAGFLVADEFFVVYERMPGVGATHWLVLCALLLSGLASRPRSGDGAAE